MKLTHLFAVLALTAGLTGCKKKETKEEGASPTASSPKSTEQKPAEPSKPAPSGRSIPNANGLVVDAPAKWIDNGIGGAAGMHLDADAGMFMVRETAPEEAAKDLATWKTETEQVLFQKWISADALPDGFKALYTMDKITMKGDEPVKDGTTFAFHVRRKIGDKPHDCYGSAAAQETAAEGLELCLKVAAK